MINPWIWYIVNDKMPSFPTLSYREIGVFCLWLLFAVLWGTGMFFGMEWFRKTFCEDINEYMYWWPLLLLVLLGAFVALTVWLLPKGLDRAYRKDREAEARRKEKEKKDSQKPEAV